MSGQTEGDGEAAPPARRATQSNFQVAIDADTHRRMKLVAVLEGRSLREIARTLLETYLEQQWPNLDDDFGQLLGPPPGGDTTDTP
mgnify:CR=1 FL=1